MEYAVPAHAAAALRDAGRVVVFTGAGMSAESGVPTFRDALTGLWERFDAQALATPQAFQNDPDLVWGWYEWRRTLVQQTVPNPGHRAVAAIQARAPHSVLVTQNVDDLHERAGSQPRSTCTAACSRRAAPAVPDRRPLWTNQHASRRRGGGYHHPGVSTAERRYARVWSGSASRCRPRRWPRRSTRRPRVTCC